ncbi:hypothetical protein ABW19_dt0208911 [Dactylella cylindrospora]|nr:hypothetical protein ABW19_dt0208911 [Dactylella cylindrospora]
MSANGPTPHSSIPFSTSGQIPIPTPPSSSGSNRAPSHFGHLSSPKFVHPARRRGSADSYTSNDDDYSHSLGSSRSQSYSYSLTSPRSNHRSPHLSASPGACLIIRSNSLSGPSTSGSSYSNSNSGSPKSSPRLRYQSSQSSQHRDSLSSSLPGDLEFDVEPLSPYSYVPRRPSAPPSRKNSRDDAYSHVLPPAQANVLSQAPKEQPEKQEEHTIQLHMMPKNMLLPLPDRNAEMKHLLEHNKSLTNQIRRALGEEQFAIVNDLWTRTRRSEVSDHEWLRRSRYFLVDRTGGGAAAGERVWSEWCMMVGWDHSRDLRKDENGVVRPVEEYAEKVGHMECLEEDEEE